MPPLPAWASSLKAITPLSDAFSYHPEYVMLLLAQSRSNANWISKHESKMDQSKITIFNTLTGILWDSIYSTRSLLQKTDHTNAGNSILYSLRIVCGFFYAPQSYEHWRVVRRGQRFILLIRDVMEMQMSLQRQLFLLSYIKTLNVGPAGVLNPRPPAQLPDAQPTEPTGGGVQIRILELFNQFIHNFDTGENWSAASYSKVRDVRTFVIRCWS